VIPWGRLNNEKPSHAAHGNYGAGGAVIPWGRLNKAKPLRLTPFTRLFIFMSH